MTDPSAKPPSKRFVIAAAAAFTSFGLLVGLAIVNGGDGGGTSDAWFVVVGGIATGCLLAIPVVWLVRVLPLVGDERPVAERLKTATEARAGLIAIAIVVGAVAFAWALAREGRASQIAGLLGGLGLVAAVILADLSVREVNDEVRRRKTTEGDSPPSESDVEESPPVARGGGAQAEELALIRRLRKSTALTTGLTMLILAVTAAGALLAFRDEQELRTYLGLSAFLLVLFLSLQVTRRRSREIEADLRQAKHETAVHDPKGPERALQLFLKHQFELKRYYDQTLRHGALVLYTGLLMLFLGAAVVITALFLIEHGNSDDEIVLATLAGVTGILTNFMGAIYLFMHGRATDAVSEFHSRLSHDHSVQFANLILNTHPDDEYFRKFAFRVIDFAELTALVSPGGRPHPKSVREVIENYVSRRHKNQDDEKSLEGDHPEGEQANGDTKD
jgi:Ca2+/Na+ antiporter